MKVNDAIISTEAEIRREVLMDTIQIMEFLEEYEEELRKYDEETLGYIVAKKMHAGNVAKFERNIKLLGVLRKGKDLLLCKLPRATAMRPLSR